MKAFVAQIL